MAVRDAGGLASKYRAPSAVSITRRPESESRTWIWRASLPRASRTMFSTATISPLLLSKAVLIGAAMVMSAPARSATRLPARKVSEAP